MSYCIVVVVLCTLHEFSGAYKAAVVEYAPVTADTPQNTILKNLEGYKTFTQKAKSQGADIIVFPEYGLTTMVARPENYSVKISTNTPLVKSLSTLAKQQRIYLVVNLLEKIKSKRKINYYNTNLVFDRSGTLILKYQKINLFGEPNLASGSKNQNLTFTTDFGVTFATFTCFDILYTNPSRTIWKNQDINNVAYPTSWFSTLPFYSSLTVQHGYSSSTGVNLLASNVGEPQNSHGGTGIYLGGKIAKLHISDVPGSTLLVHEVPKRDGIMQFPKTVGESNRSNLSNYVTLRDFRASDYNFKKIDLNRKNSTNKTSALSSTTICYDQFCCTFEITVDNKIDSANIYRVMAYDGIVPFDISTAHIRVCSLLICGDDSNDSCGTRIKSSTKFKKISVHATLKKSSTTFYNPLTLDYYLQPLAQISFHETSIRDESLIQLSTLTEYHNVVVFGIFGKID